jgi:hypothetical protein
MLAIDDRRVERRLEIQERIKERTEVPLGVGLAVPAAHRTFDDDIVRVVGGEPGGVEIVKGLLPPREQGEDLVAR